MMTPSLLQAEGKIDLPPKSESEVGVGCSYSNNNKLIVTDVLGNVQITLHELIPLILPPTTLSR